MTVRKSTSLNGKESLVVEATPETDETLLTILRFEMQEALGGQYAMRLHGSPSETGWLAAMHRVLQQEPATMMLKDAQDRWEECLKEIERQKKHIAGLQAALRSANTEANS